MKEQYFNKVYPTRKKMSHHFSDLRPIILLIHEMYCDTLEELEQSLKYAKLIEQELFDLGIVSFKVTLNNEDKIDMDTQVGQFQKSIWLLLNKVERLKHYF